MRMKNRLTLRYNSARSSDFVCTILTLFALSMVIFAFIATPATDIFRGMLSILTEPAGLITDYMAIGTVGGAFLNAGLLMLFAIWLLRFLKLPFTGMSVACCFLMGGFALFGKNIINIIPILLGVLLFARFERESFKKFVYVALFGTTLSPIVTEIALLSRDFDFYLFRIALPILVGIIIGFVLPSVAAYTLRVHQGYNLYNVGFAAGLVGLIFVSILRSFGHDFEPRLIWSTGNNRILTFYLMTVFALMVIVGFIANHKSFNGIVHLTRHSGRAIADFVVMDGAPVTLINMGVVGIFATAYVLIVGGDLNGPTIGGILTIVGFGSFGKHMKNIIWVMLGVVISSFVMVWKLSDPSVLLAALFSTCLAPIAGHYGIIWGIAAGIIHSSVVLNVGVLYGGLNLYNNGFAAGLTCMVLLPLIGAVRRGKKISEE